MRRLKGDLSAPVLAIIVTIGIISAGLVLLAWFWWFAPQVGKTGTLIVVGQPVIICTESKSITPRAYLSVKNVGNSPVAIKEVIIAGFTNTSSIVNDLINVGASTYLEVQLPLDLCTSVQDNRTVEGVIITDSGTYTAAFLIIR